ncbi:Dihydrofolate synthase [Alkalibacterium sp. AK22]|uniref:bifunctional folylpolyglutamate synthase/dihydrofolate synthase n=1 Tax=Alkalibacterium sp. AK22 TaxID=1229520 RepID=UPI0004506163|nr:folylpolyglutamate synthase/dihydrofolate synthase family protein [Alkalibacterium sp. AK22]EXJ24289.1 Dihydrofolate synthase [Alkalibacterium sp. AK22]
MMDMKGVIELVNTNRGTGQKEDLHRMRLLLEKLGNPQQALRCVHVAGTNGKGSTSAFLSHILREAGIRTGIYTSPHLEKINERIMIDGVRITDKAFIQTTKAVARHVESVEEETGERLYSFEILTAVSLLYFKEQECELVILEAGIGGRLDATNVIERPEVAIITSIGYDHMKVLGETIEQIASEKAGIIKEGGTLIYSEMTPSVHAVIEGKARESQATVRRIRTEELKEVQLSDQGGQFSFKGQKELSVRLIGRHQLMNAALAVEAAYELNKKGFEIQAAHIRSGLVNTGWPGRMEKISEQPTIVIDGAHNPEGVAVLKNNLKELYTDQSLILVCGMMKDKDYMSMIRQVRPLCKKVMTVSPDPYRGFNPFETARLLSDEGTEAEAFDSVTSVIDKLKQESSSKDTVIVMGSLYLIGAFRASW